MTFFRSASAALIAATIAFGALAPISTAAFASDQGREVKPLAMTQSQAQIKKRQMQQAQMQKKQRAMKLAQAKKQQKLAAAAAIGLAILAAYQDKLEDKLD